jgi:hypothetical protein
MIRSQKQTPACFSFTKPEVPSSSTYRATVQFHNNSEKPERKAMDGKQAGNVVPGVPMCGRQIYTFLPWVTTFAFTSRCWPRGSRYARTDEPPAPDVEMHVLVPANTYGVHVSHFADVLSPPKPWARKVIFLAQSNFQLR